MMRKLQEFFPNFDFETVKMTALVNAYSALQIPLLGFITPRVMELSDERAVVRVRLDRRTRNHLGVMYFGALSMGAELSIAVRCLQAISQSGKRIDFIFKDFEAQFLKRADGHVHFVCEETSEIANLVGEAAASSERVERKFEGFAYVPGKSLEPVMKYKLTLSVKKRV